MNTKLDDGLNPTEFSECFCRWVDEYMEDLRRAGANGGGRERKKTSIMWHMRMNSSGWVIAEALRQN